MKVLIGINHELIRYGMIQLLKDIRPIESMVMVDTTEEFIETLRKYEFDLIILDVSLEGAGGLRCVLSALNEIHHLSNAVFMFDDHDMIDDKYELINNSNFHGVFHENSSLGDLMEFFQKILAGDRVILNMGKNSTERILDESEMDESLSNREKEVFHLKVRGYTVKDTAELLNISPKTVENHRRNIKRKLQISKNSEWYEWAKKLNMV